MLCLIIDHITEAAYHLAATVIRVITFISYIQCRVLDLLLMYVHSKFKEKIIYTVHYCTRKKNKLGNKCQASIQAPIIRMWLHNTFLAHQKHYLARHTYYHSLFSFCSICASSLYSNCVILLALVQRPLIIIAQWGSNHI